MSEIDLGFTHIYREPQTPNSPVLLLLHGTGGNEESLLSLAQLIDPQAGILSPRGQVLEHGMPRFFRRLSEGVFDEPDLRLRTVQMAEFISTASHTYGFDQRRVVAVGFSNGANIAASLLLLSPETLAGAILLAPMVPLTANPLPDLSGVPVFIGAGKLDTMIPVQKTMALADLLKRCGADVTLKWHLGGHVIVEQELSDAAAWLQKLSFA